MTVNRRKKSNTRRGSRTHGWGSPKKHRGSGSRGGVGNAGSGKKGQQKMTTKNLTGERIGKYGFKRPAVTINNPKTINIDDLEKNIDNYITNGNAKKSNNITEIDTTKLGYDKILGRGKLTSKLKITSKQFSKTAIEKIKKAGGEAIVKESTQKKAPVEKKEIPL
ncbi:MAG: uL15m family ribosomal protein [archaeon]